MIKKILAAACAALLASSAIAEAPEAAIKKNVEAALGEGAKVDSVRKAGALNLYEVVINGEILYTDEKVTHLVFGQIVEAKTQRNLTQERLDKLSAIKFSDLPLDLAIKQVRGNGKRVLATFEDPNCTYCKKLAKELQGITDVTTYTFVYPIFPNSQDVAKAIWCAPDRAKAWNDYLINGNAPPAAAKCDASAIGKVVALGQKLNIRGTPALFFGDGTRVPGYMPAAKLEEAMNKVAAGR